MSVEDDILDEAELLWRSSNPDLPAGENGFERDAGIGENLDEATQVPHVFTHDSVGTATTILWNQEALVVSTRFDLWAPTGEDLAAIAARVQAFRAAVRGNPTLSGKVRRAWVSRFGVIDAPAMGRVSREGRAVLSVELVES